MTQPTTADGRRLLLALLRQQWRPLALAVLAALGYFGTLLLVPLLTEYGVDGLTHGDDDKLLVACGIILGMAPVRAALGALRKYNATRLASRSSASVREQVYIHLQELDLGFHTTMGVGQMLARCSGDVTLVEQLISLVPYAIQCAFVGIGGAAAMFFVAPKLASIVLATVAVTGFFALRRARPMYPISIALQSTLGDFSSFVEQQVHGIRVVKGHGFESAHRSQGGELALDLRTQGSALGKQRALFLSSFQAVPGLALVAVVLAAATPSLRGGLSGGGLIAFFQLVALLVTPVLVSAQLLAVWPQSSAALRRICEVLQAVPALTSPEHPQALGAHVPSLSFRGVTFGYDDRLVLDGLDLDVPAGSSLALVGPSGCGKSTLLRLAVRLLDPQQGSVLLAGHDAKDLDLAELRGSVAVVLESPELFSGTIAENVLIGASALPVEELARVLQDAGCDFVQRLAKGVDDDVGQRGSALSGGQRQRVALARGLAREAPVLLLDDVTSALDPTMADAVRLALKGSMQGRTTILVAQQVETALLADRVALLGDGKVVAVGTHEELLQLDVYRRALALGVSA